MSSSIALVALVTVAFVSLATTDEGMGLCYRCPLHHLDGDEGSPYAWVKSFLKEIKRRCPGLNTTPKVTKPPNTSTRTSTKASTTTTHQPTATTDPPSTTTDPPTTTTNPPTTTTKPPTAITEPPTIAPTPPPGAAADCQALLDAGNTASGVYTIYPTSYPGGLEVRCDMTTDSKAWIVFQRRVDGAVSFIRSWAEYRDGFGDKEGSFWLGNEILRRLTEPEHQEWQMRVNIVLDEASRATDRFALYYKFRITGELYNLSLVFSGLPGFIQDSLSPPQAGNGHPFTTYDSDNDQDSGLNCADSLKGGWWFDTCGTESVGSILYSNLNGEYGQGLTGSLAFVRGIVWSTYRNYVFVETDMKMWRVS